MPDGRPPSAPRLPGILGVAFVLGAFFAATSFEEAYTQSTSTRARERAQRQADELVWKLSRNAVPQAAQPTAEALKSDFVGSALRRRPVRAALATTHGLLGALLALCAAYALRLRPWGRAWLLQIGGAGIALALAQTALLLEQAQILGRYAPAILAATQAVPLTGLADQTAWRVVVLLPPALVGAAKIAFFVWLMVVLRRPAVRALFRV